MLELKRVQHIFIECYSEPIDTIETWNRACHTIAIKNDSAFYNTTKGSSSNQSRNITHCNWQIHWNGITWKNICRNRWYMI